MSVIEVQPMPPGYRLTVTNGNGWQAFGWVQERVTIGPLDTRGRGSLKPIRTLVAARHGIGDAEKAAADAWEHSRSNT